MILIKNGILMVEGPAADIISETTIVLREVYMKTKADFGEEAANEIIVEMGRIAVAEDVNDVIGK